ncbi:MAG: RNase A-like domain-containing protein [Cellvibrionaceae bacterium]
MSKIRENNIMETKAHTKRKKHSLFKRLTVYIVSFTLLYQPLVPAISSALTDAYIQDRLNSFAAFELSTSSEYQYQTPSYLEESTPSAMELESFRQYLEVNHRHVLDKPQYIPIGIGDITTIIPVYKKDKIVGTPLVQSRYIRSQIHEALGRNLINVEDHAYATETVQLNTLYANALKYINAVPGITYGDKLSFRRDYLGIGIAPSAWAPYDMVWPELREINGEKVIVPLVYLSYSTLQSQAVTSNVTELLSNITLDALTIDQVDVQFGRDTFLNVANDLLNNQGSINSEGELEIVAGGNVTNLSGLIQSKGDLRIAAHSVENQTVVHRYNRYNNNRRDQGTRYGEIAGINSNDGSVTLRSYSDIVFQGAQSFSGSSLTLAANGNIYIGSQQAQSAVNGYKYNGSSISYLQSSLTAEESIQLVANGEILIDAAEIVSDQGHIEILAGLGVTIEDDLTQSQFVRKFKGGQESAYKTVAMRALLDAGKDIRIHSEFGDITLRATNITSTEGTSVKAANGGVNLLMTVENDHYSYHSERKNAFTVRTTNRGHDIETGVPNSIVGGLVVESANGLKVEYEGNPDFTLDEQIAELSKFEGLEWMADVRANTSDADWHGIELKYEEWNETTTSLSPAFAAVISISVAIVTSGAASGFAEVVAGSSTGVIGTAVAAGASAFISQATLALANGVVDGDIGAALEQLASSDTLKSLAIAMVTAGAIEAVDAEFFQVSGNGVDADSILIDPNSAQQVVDATTGQLTTQYTLSFTGQAVQAVTHATVQAGVQNIISGGDFEDSFVQSLGQQGVNAIGEYMATEIGNAANVGDINKAIQYIAHAGAGCLVGLGSAAVSDGIDDNTACVSGAGGAVIGEFVGELYESKLKDDLQEWADGILDTTKVPPTAREIQVQINVLKAKGADISKLAGALAAFTSGYDVNTASSTAHTTALFNALSKTNEAGIKYYKWVDPETGKVVYGDRPPSLSGVYLVNQSATGIVETSLDELNQQELDRKKARTEYDAWALKVEVNCRFYEIQSECDKLNTAWTSTDNSGDRLSSGVFDENSPGRDALETALQSLENGGEIISDVGEITCELHGACSVGLEIVRIKDGEATVVSAVLTILGIKGVSTIRRTDEFVTTKSPGVIIKDELGGSLIRHENFGGHTIQRHVGKSDAQLIDRFSLEPHIPSSSTFTDLETATRAIGDVVVVNKNKIESWFQSSDSELPLRMDVNYKVGRTIESGSMAIQESQKVFVLIRRDPLMPKGYRIHTAYPE